ncbi:nuclear transport factor 2 family protein [Mucilaginibacter agri]|uniref:Isomerase n=1 Tax=Mucilaginibacter agri TaxID=2695265 RepID=A0A965ZHA3_9SPHI|nr:nuclear transport factor 2 family protein [Mucilaginibacter agri]NCD70700.1 isomerase [Mucilaginibacter agri]
MITSVEEMIEKYVSSWNEQGLEQYKAAFATCWAEDATYTDPDYDLKGVNAIAELAQFSLERIPSRTFSVLTKPEYHHHVGRYNWQVHLPEGTKDGFDYFEFNDDFKITRIVSFF